MELPRLAGIRLDATISFIYSLTQDKAQKFLNYIIRVSIFSL